VGVVLHATEHFYAQLRFPMSKLDAVLIENERSEYTVSKNAGQLDVCLTITSGELIPGTTVTLHLITSPGNEAGTLG
jgi:hypothetical protein